MWATASVLLINMLLTLVFPLDFLLWETRPSDPSSTFTELAEPDQGPFYFPGEGGSSAVYLPMVARENLPPRENITLSVFAENGDSLEVFEKNLDSNGIPILVDGFTNGNGYHPSYICRYALYVAAAYDANASEENFRKISNLMTWIKDNRVERNHFITWELYEDLPSFNLTAPWTSALTNAWCSGALLHGYKITGDPELEALARAGLEYLFTPVMDGGGLYEFDNGDIWFEECPNVDTPSHILNGFIYAIDILDMFSSYYRSDRYQDFFDRAVSSLVNRIDLYDVGYGSIYDLYTRGNKLGMGYHELHILQLYYMYLRTGNPHLLEISEKWYALQYQNQYELLASPPTIKNLSVIHDGFYWYNYVLVNFPLKLSFNFDRAYELRAVNLFLYGSNDPTDGMSILYQTGESTHIEIPPANYILEWAGSNNTNGHITNVYTLTFNEPIRSQSLILNFEKTLSNDVGVFREIGVLKDMSDEYQKKYGSLYKLEDIVSRRQLSALH